MKYYRLEPSGQAILIEILEDPPPGPDWASTLIIDDANASGVAKKLIALFDETVSHLKSVSDELLVKAQGMSNPDDAPIDTFAILTPA